MRNRIFSMLISLLAICISYNSAFAFFDIEAEMAKAYNSFGIDMNTAYGRAGFASLHKRYNFYKIEYIKQRYENPNLYKEEFNNFFQKSFPIWLWDANLIGNFKEWYNISNPKEALNNYSYNKSEYIKFLQELKNKDQLFGRMPYEDILKIQIYSYFVVISGGMQNFEVAKRNTFIWPLCKKGK